jgi:hypothetical protein
VVACLYKCIDCYTIILNSEEPDYLNHGIIIKNYPELIQVSEHEYQRNWKIIFKENISVDLESSSSKLSYHGFNVRLEQKDCKSILAAVKTNYVETSYLFFNTCNLFVEIDYLLGEIDIIQDRKRNDWYPWLAHVHGNTFNTRRCIMREIEVGLRHTRQEGLIFFGIEEVNEFLQNGSKIILIEAGGAITKKNENENESESKNINFEISGFFITIKIDEFQNSLENK